MKRLAPETLVLAVMILWVLSFAGGMGFMVWSIEDCFRTYHQAWYC